MLMTLPNPVNDARLVSDSLSSLGFEVRLDLNLKAQMTLGPLLKACFQTLVRRKFLFYYAGHASKLK